MVANHCGTIPAFPSFQFHEYLPSVKLSNLRNLFSGTWRCTELWRDQISGATFEVHVMYHNRQNTATLYFSSKYQTIQTTGQTRSITGQHGQACIPGTSVWRHTTWRDVTPCDMTSHKVTWRHTVPCDMTSYHVTWRPIMLSDVEPHDTRWSTNGTH